MYAVPDLGHPVAIDEIYLYIIKDNRQGPCQGTQLTRAEHGWFEAMMSLAVQFMQPAVVRT